MSALALEISKYACSLLVQDAQEGKHFVSTLLCALLALKEVLGKLPRHVSTNMTRTQFLVDTTPPLLLDSLGSSGLGSLVPLLQTAQLQPSDDLPLEIQQIETELNVECSEQIADWLFQSNVTVGLKMERLFQALDELIGVVNLPMGELLWMRSVQTWSNRTMWLIASHQFNEAVRATRATTTDQENRYDRASAGS